MKRLDKRVRSEVKGLRQADAARGRDTCLRERMLSNRSTSAKNQRSFPTTGNKKSVPIMCIYLSFSREGLLMVI